MLTTLACFFGLFVLYRRLWPRSEKVGSRIADAPVDLATAVRPFVSIIVPCRNEESNVARILDSLGRLEYPSYEVIVVDDGSTDRTSEIAANYSIRLIEASAKPEGWIGKTWACHQGAQVAEGEFLLFTDADTIHEPDSLTRAVERIQSTGASLLSAPPFHECRLPFERWLGSFQMLPFLITAFQDKPRKERLFAIGQYLLWRKKDHLRLDAHREIRSSLAEDIEQARLCLASGSRYCVYLGPQLYRVQMFDSLETFAKGWIRLFRVGFKYASIASFIELLSVIHLFAIGVWEPTLVRVLTFLLGAAVIAKWQTRYGRFNTAGAVLAPIGIIVFTVLSAWGGLKTLSGAAINWRGREYRSA